MEETTTIDIIVVYQQQEYYVSTQACSDQKTLVVDLLQCQLLSLVGVIPDEQILISSTGEIQYSHNKTDVATIAVSAESHPRFFLFSRSDSTYELASDWRQICTKSTFGDAAMVQPAYRMSASSGGDPLATLICEPCARTCTTGFQPVTPMEWTASKTLMSRFVSDVSIVSGDIDVAAPAGFTKIPEELNFSASGNYTYLCIKRGGPRAVTHISVMFGDNKDIKSSAEESTRETQAVTIDYDHSYGSADLTGTSITIMYDTMQDNGNMEELDRLAITDIAVVIGEQAAPLCGYIKITRNLNEGVLDSEPVYLYYRMSFLGGFVCESGRDHSDFGECLFVTRHASRVKSVLDVMERGLSTPHRLLASERRRKDTMTMEAYYRHHQPAMLKRLQSGLQRAQSYENKYMQEEALKRIPIEKLHERARANPSPTPLYQDELLKQLLHWFKHEFFAWMNHPRCSACKYEKTQSVRMEGPSTSEEIDGQASRVEVYMCSACGALTRFPRYNDPVKLLDTRTGRCGEWANCFTLCSRAMGFEARYVLDVTDHVWTEVYSEYHQRWLHCDSCENQLDCPLTYEVGWGKKLSYVFSFSHDHVIDTARRYTQNWAAMRTRRQDVSETWLRTTIGQMNDELWKRQTPDRVAILTARAKSEHEELLRGRATQKAEGKGRISGSAEWKSQRNEDGKEKAEKTITSDLSMAKTVLQAADILHQICKNWVVGCQSPDCFSPFCFTGRTRSSLVKTYFNVTERAAQALQVINGLNKFHLECLVSLQCSKRSVALRNFLWERKPLLYLPLQDPPSKDGNVPLIDISGYGGHACNSQHCALRKPFHIPGSEQVINTDNGAESHRSDRAFGMQLHGGKFLNISKLTVPGTAGFVLSFLVRFDYHGGLIVPQSGVTTILKVRLGANKSTFSVKIRACWKQGDCDFSCEVRIGKINSKSRMSAASLLSFGQYAHIAIVHDKSKVVIMINGVETLVVEGEYQGYEQEIRLRGPGSGPLNVATVISHVAVIPMQSFKEAYGLDGIRSEERCSEVAAKAQSGYRVAQVLMWGHEFLDGIQFVYEKTVAPGATDALSTQSTSLYGSLVGNEIAKRQASQPTVILELMQDEVVTRVSGRKGAWIDCITLCTNFGRTVTCGGSGGGEFIVPTPACTEIRSISFSADTRLTDLWAFVLESSGVKDFEDKTEQQLLKIFSSCKSSLRPSAVAAALRYLENIARQPEEPKFQRIRASNHFFAGSVGALGDRTARLFMLWCGFEELMENSEQYYTFNPRQKDCELSLQQLKAEAYKRLHLLKNLKT